MSTITNFKKHIKRRNTKGYLLMFLLFFLVFPYILSIFCGNERLTLVKGENVGKIWVEEKYLWGTKQIEMEEYLPGMLAGTIPSSFEKETLKAQAIILRSYCVCLAENKGGKKVISAEKLKDFYYAKEDMIKLEGVEGEKAYALLQEAVEETKGKILLYNNEVISPPFFHSGNGRTRNISDYPQGKTEYGYLKSVICEKDIEAEGYSNYKEVSLKEFEESIRKYLGKNQAGTGKIVLYKDSTDYVKVVEIGGRQINGEDFRDLFGMDSSCFQIEKINDKIQFKTRGRGHGFGFSQFQANELAKDGKEAVDILMYFFQNIVLEKI